MSKETALAVATGVTPEVPVTPPQPTQTTLPSTPFAQMAKKEAELVKQREAFKSERKQFETEKAQVSEYQKRIQEYEQTKKTDPVAALKMLGFTETDIFNYMAAQEKKEPTPEERAAQAAAEAAEAKIKAFEESQQKKIIEEQTKKDNALIQGFRSDLMKTIQSNPDKYEYCNYYGPEATALAYEITLEVVKQSAGKDVLSPKEAISMAEEYFEEKDKEMNKLKKRGFSQPKAPEKPAEPTRSRTLSTPNPQDAPKPAIQRTRTLSNAATSTVASARQIRNETKEQKRERLIEALRNGVKL